jgi:flavodoxin short chain
MATAIIYWSGTGNTEAMAKAIEQGLQSKGAETTLLTVGDATADACEQYERIAFGCPSLGVEVLEEDDFEPFFTAVEGKLKDKKVALFGSYGWGDGEWMRDWQKRTEATGAQLFEEGFIQQEAPDEALCKSFGERFAAF